MGEDSNIQWTDHTFNPWRGCTKISPGCKNCYAEAFVTKRQGLPVWGAGAARKVAAESTWRDPERWNRQAAAWNERKRVFCASLADVFEDYQGPDSAAILAARARLFALIEKTQSLDWLLLTKRPEQVKKMVPKTWLSAVGFPRNVWIGCTVEDQEQAEKRLPHLLGVPAAVRFVSYEPALEAVDFARVRILSPDPPNGPGAWLNALTGHIDGPDDVLPLHVDWLIVGGESGPGARPFHVSWARGVVRQCADAGVPVFVKQLGATVQEDIILQPQKISMTDTDGNTKALEAQAGAGALRAAKVLGMAIVNDVPRMTVRLHDPKGGDMNEWPSDLRVRELPRAR